MLFILSACVHGTERVYVFHCLCMLKFSLFFTSPLHRLHSTQFCFVFLLFASAFSGVSIFFLLPIINSLLCFVPHTTSSIRTISFDVFLRPYRSFFSSRFFSLYFWFMPFFLVGAVAFIHMYCAEIVVFQLVLACHGNTCDVMLPWRKYSIQFKSSKIKAKKKNAGRSATKGDERTRTKHIQATEIISPFYLQEQHLHAKLRIIKINKKD